WIKGQPSLLGVNAVLLPQLSGERNVSIGAQALGLTPAEVRERYDEIVELADIGEAIDRPMSTYSSGQGARLRFAISTASRPDVLMIDEALATGDAAFQRKSMGKLHEILEDASTVFLVSHSASSITDFCTRALWLDHGRLVMDGPAADVMKAYASGKVPPPLSPPREA
ncbi:MAG TPA: ATP-binding cassette domain-containing protein, partial [Propionibacteriaceae bacterium]|nr:ATP-binding cassette domain-containing protein [Propionibacteriaceae bacterium]